MKIPEWEIRDAVCWNPELIGTDHELKLIDFQVPVKRGSQEKYLDVLFNIQNDSKKRYLILELKKETATDSAVKQVLEYRDWFCTRNYLKETEVEAMVAAPHIPSNLDHEDVKFSEIDLQEVHETHLRGKKDEEKLAEILRETSEENPLFAHELLQGRGARRFKGERTWLWMFYTILDGGGPAQTFVKAYRSMKKQEIHLPRDLINLKNEHGEEKAARKLLPHLRKATLFNPGRGDIELR